MVAQVGTVSISDQAAEKRAQRAAENRRNFPECMAVADAFRDIFGPGVTLLYAAENGKKIGKMAPEIGTWITAKEWLEQSERMKRLGLLPDDDKGIKQLKRGRK